MLAHTIWVLSIRKLVSQQHQCSWILNAMPSFKDLIAIHQYSFEYYVLFQCFHVNWFMSNWSLVHSALFPLITCPIEMHSSLRNSSSWHCSDLDPGPHLEGGKYQYLSHTKEASETINTIQLHMQHHYICCKVIIGKSTRLRLNFGDVLFGIIFSLLRQASWIDSAFC